MARLPGGETKRQIARLPVDGQGPERRNLGGLRVCRVATGKAETVFVTTQSFVLKKNVSYCDSIVADVAA